MYLYRSYIKAHELWYERESSSGLYSKKYGAVSSQDSIDQSPKNKESKSCELESFEEK